MLEFKVKHAFRKELSFPNAGKAILTIYMFIFALGAISGNLRATDCNLSVCAGFNGDCYYVSIDCSLWGCSVRECGGCDLPYDQQAQCGPC